MKLLVSLLDSEDYKWYQLSVEQVHEIINLNREGEKIESLSEFEIVETLNKVSFEDAVGEDSLTRFDTAKTNRRGSKRNNRRRSKNRNNPNQNNSGNTTSKRIHSQKQNKKTRPNKFGKNNQNNA